MSRDKKKLLYSVGQADNGGKIKRLTFSKEIGGRRQILYITLLYSIQYSISQEHTLLLLLLLRIYAYPITANKSTFEPSRAIEGQVAYASYIRYYYYYIIERVLQVVLGMLERSGVSFTISVRRNVLRPRDPRTTYYIIRYKFYYITQIIYNTRAYTYIEVHCV